MDTDSLAITVDIACFEPDSLNFADVRRNIKLRRGLTVICSGMAGYTVYGVLTESQKMAICAQISVNCL